MLQGRFEPQQIRAGAGTDVHRGCCNAGRRVGEGRTGGTGGTPPPPHPPDPTESHRVGVTVGRAARLAAPPSAVP